MAETSYRHFTWDADNRLTAFATQPPGAEPSVHATYLYDATGRRAKKLVRRQGGRVEAVHYLGPVEHHRWDGPATGPRASPTTWATTSTAARWSPTRPDRSPPVEEFTPYGETSFGGATRKRYRFTGKERDEESGRAYHGARYYAPALARWTAADPAGHAGGLPDSGTGPRWAIDETQEPLFDREWVQMGSFSGWHGAITSFAYPENQLFPGLFLPDGSPSSRPRRTPRASFELEPDTGLLLPFEGMGVDSVWRLERPRAANTLDYRTIADVLLTVEYTALHDAEHRRRVIRTLDRRYASDRLFSVRDQAPRHPPGAVMAHR